MKKILLTCVAAIGIAAAANAQTIMSEDFSGATPPAMPSGWTMAKTGAGNGWVTTTAATDLYFGTVPNTGVHSTYAVVDEYGTPGNNPTSMTSPVFSLAGAATPYLAYDYIYFEAHLTASPYAHEQAWVEFTTDGTTWTFLDSVTALGSAAWATKYVALTPSSSTTCQVRFNYKDQAGNIIGVAIDEVKVFNLQNNDLKLLSVTPVSGDPQTDFFISGSGSATFKGVVTNLGASPVTSFDVSYQVGAGSWVTNTISSISIASLASYSFTCATPYAVTSVGNQPVKIAVTASGDPVLTNDSATTAINGVASMPTKYLMCEEGTGSWCGFCVRGIIFMDSLWNSHPSNVNIVAVHDKLNGTDIMAGDNTTTVNYDHFVTNNISGYPSVLYDRRYSDDPSNAFDYYNLMTSNYFGFADMAIAVTNTGTTVTASVTVTPAIALNGDYRLALVVTEDYVHNTASGYAQHNYYGVGGAYNSTPLYGVGYNFNDSAQVIPASSLYYKFVDRYTIPDFVADPNGVATSLPSTMTAGTAYPYTFDPVTVSAGWHSNNLRVIAMLIDNNPSNFTYGMVLNSRHWVSPTLGVANVTAGIEGFNVFPNPAKDDAHVSFELKNEGTVQFSIYDVTGHLVYNSPSEKMNAGGQQLNFSTANLASGTYNVIVATETGNISGKLTVVR